MKYHFMAGLPRSGSTLISSILNQNPYVHSEGMSPLSDLIMNAYRTVTSNYFKEECDRTYRGLYQRQELLAGMFDTFYNNAPSQVTDVIDKNRTWMLQDRWAAIQWVFGEPKIIFPVRDIEQVAKSYIRIHLDNGYSLEESEAIVFGKGYPLAAPVASVALGKARGVGLFVHYDDLIANPKEQMDRITTYLKLPEWDYQFYDIENSLPEADWLHLRGMLEIRPKIEKRAYEVEISDNAKFMIQMMNEVLDNPDSEHGIDFIRKNGV